LVSLCCSVLSATQRKRPLTLPSPPGEEILFPAAYSLAAGNYSDIVVFANPSGKETLARMVDLTVTPKRPEASVPARLWNQYE